MKSCMDCFHLKAIIPVVNGEIRYEVATGYCSKGILSTHDGEIKMFINVIKNRRTKNKSFTFAERCPHYDGEDETLLNEACG